MVAWIEPALNWREHWVPSRTDYDAPRTPAKATPSHLYVVESHPLLPKFDRFPQMSARLLRKRVTQASRLLKKRGARHIALYLWRPEFAAALGSKDYDFSCYHIDDEYSFATTEQPNSAAEVALIRAVDHVIVHSPRLFRKKGNINPQTTMIPNGVDFEAFSARQNEPLDLRSIPRPRVGYIGVIKKQLDLQLMLELARTRQDWSFVFVGPVGVLGDKVDIWQQLTREPNVHPLGERSVAELPAYAQHYDVAVMCYDVTDYTNSIFPLKLNEYLASGRPVVSSSIESVLPFSDVVALANGANEWERVIVSMLNESANSPSAVSLRRAVAKEYDWTDLAERVAEIFRDGSTKTATTSARVG
jgi:UDP-galactopyranose mutase